MFKDVIIPHKIGTNYIFKTKIVCFEITHYAVQALEVVCHKEQKTIINYHSVPIKEYSVAHMSAALKKIMHDVGSYDEVVVSLSNTQVIFKELEVPFISYEKIQLIVGYQVQELLPFSVDDAVIDFLILEEQPQKPSSRLLVAAAKKQDVELVLSFFEKAKISVSLVNVDMFGAYTLYQQLYVLRHGLLNSHDTIVECMVVLHVDCVTVLYFERSILKKMRVIPYGMQDYIEWLERTHQKNYNDYLDIVSHAESSELYADDSKRVYQHICKEIEQTLVLFETQLGASYKKPHTILITGTGADGSFFIEYAQKLFTTPLELFPIQLLIKIPGKVLNSLQSRLHASIDMIGVLLFFIHNAHVNFSKFAENRKNDTKLYMQLGVLCALTIGCLGGLWWRSSVDMRKWERHYTVSKKEMSKAIEETMNIDLSQVKNVKDIVEQAQDTLHTERKLWFAFSKQQEFSYLRYLEDITKHIDRESLDLDLKKVTMNPELVMLSGTLSKGVEAWAVFQEELQELTLLELAEEPRDITFHGDMITFNNVALEVKNKGQQEHD